ncbi:hypothetical protein [Rhizobium sp. YS-1r]|uniref:hypothetical protein n=1 Tax=Rhizobium sp. YS-1r TaxID=1532558 RepID=UPI001FCA9A87|nr:hypothetical protein [Rhizobium sp. YS-1r]
MRYNILMAAMLFSLSVQAADIRRESGSEGIDLISVSGTFTEGEDATFRKLAAESDRAVVALNSGGGNLHVGLEIGRAIRLRGFATAVPPDVMRFGLRADVAGGITPPPGCGIETRLSRRLSPRQREGV